MFEVSLAGAPPHLRSPQLSASSVDLRTTPRLAPGSSAHARAGCPSLRGRGQRIRTMLRGGGCAASPSPVSEPLSRLTLGGGARPDDRVVERGPRPSLQDPNSP